METKIHSFTVGGLTAGAVAIVLVEDEIGLVDTIFHTEKLGFRNIILASKSQPVLPKHCDTGANICWISIPSHSRDHIRATLNTLINQLSGRWIYYCFNAEFLFFPFQENRLIDDLTRFMEEERRTHVFSHVIDLYTPDMDETRLNIETAHLDASGYYAMNRFVDGIPQERQIDVFGGLKWRYSEHVPWDRQRIDRVPLFKAQTGLELDANFRLSVPEMNTYSCPWHNNLTCAIASFRTGKSLRRNPGSAAVIDSFMWGQSIPFEWRSKQLMELGMIEPGQWF